MAELIIPPELRERHRRGLARYLATEDAVVLDHRLEITGMRADGTTFPVELTITRIDVPGPPTFTGYLRDITDRKAAEAELRASRARIVEAADDARRRLERDLHDGAQQRLVELALDLRMARARLDDEPARAQRAARRRARRPGGGDQGAARAGARDPPGRSHRGRAAAGAGGARGPLDASRPRLVAVPDARFAAPVEATAYFTVAEGLTNAARYAAATQRGGRGRCAWTAACASRCATTAAAAPTRARGSGLRGLADRVAALDGVVDVISPTGGGTVLRVEIPCGS